MGFITESREQQILFGYSLDDFVDQSAKCRFIVKMVEKLDLTKLYASYSSQGGDAMDPSILLATWFLAYSEGQTSTRKLEQACRRDMHYIYASAHLKPDHTTLSRFRQRHIERLPEYFVEIIRMASQEGVSEFSSIAIDGSKLQAGCSHKRNRTGSELEIDLKRVRERIAQYLDECALIDDGEDSPHDLESVREKIAKLRELEQNLEERQADHAQRIETLQKKNRMNHKINTVEPDARSMHKVNGAPSAPAYNVQLSVDTDTQLIVAAEVTDHPTDLKQFSKQHAQVEQNLGAMADREYVADAGYHSLNQLAYIEEHQVDAVIADPRPKKRQTPQRPKVEDVTFFERSMFDYNPKDDTYRCPANDTLTFSYSGTVRGRRRHYYEATACVGCQYRSKCIKGNSTTSKRTLVRDDKEYLAENMARKSTSPEGRERMDLRKMSVEPAFGNLKENLGYRRFRLRGIRNTHGEFMLMCIGHNLNKLHRLMKSMNPALSTPLKNVFLACREALSIIRVFFEININDRRSFLLNTAL